MLLGCVCFGWKWFQEIIFTLFRMFGCHGKWLPVDQYFHLRPGNDFLPSFSLQSISGKRERERESARVRERRRNRTVSRSPGGADLQSELQATRSREDREIAPSRARASDRDRHAPSRDRDLRSIARSRRRELASLIARSRSQIAIVDDIFLGFVFSFFSKHQKIFSGKFFEMQQNTEKYFPFPEISISEKYVFSEKRFTATKHSLRAYIIKPF